MEVETLIKEIYECHKESGLYSDSFENVIYKLTNAYDYFHLRPIREARKKAKHREFFKFTEEDEDVYDLIRHAYRACIKFAYQDCSNGSFKRNINKKDIDSYINELSDTIQFNFIRNKIDRYRLNKYKADIHNDKLRFTHIEGERDFIYDEYSRHISDNVPGGKNSKDYFDVFDVYSKLNELASKKQEFESKKIFKPAKNILQAMIADFCAYYLKDFGWEIGDLRGSNYYLGEYLYVYSYLASIALFKTAYILSLNGEQEQIYEPSLMYPKERLIKDISDTTGIKEETVEEILCDMTYDYQFHKERITIYQPLFEIDGNILCSCNLLIFGYAVDKIMKVFDIKGTNKPDLTLYHKFMSDKMNSRMAESIPEMYCNLKTFQNCVLRINNQPKSEIDLIIFDLRTKKAALVELKNYTPVDNESDAIYKEDKINKAIESRLVRDKLVLDNLELFFEQNDIPKMYLTYGFSSLLVTNAYTGGVGLKETIKVVDEPLFYNILSSCNGNLELAIKTIEEETFFEMLKKDYTPEIFNQTYTYKGISVEVINLNE